MDHDARTITKALNDAPEVGGVKQFEVHLPTEFETAWDPGSTKRSIAGPAILNYYMFGDGGVAVDVKR